MLAILCRIPLFARQTYLSMLGYGRVLLLADGLLYYLNWRGRCDSQGVLSWVCLSYYFFGVVTLLPPDAIDVAPTGAGYSG